jgi:hypothetical protein
MVINKSITRSLLCAAALLLGAWTPTFPPGISGLHAQTYAFFGTCDSTDQVSKWTIQGGPPQSGPFIFPWLSSDITIRGVEVTKVVGGPTLWWMPGNNAFGDTLMWVGPGDDHGYRDFPPDTGQGFPSIANGTKLTYVDLHGACGGGGGVTIYMTLYYTLPDGT